MGSVHLGLTMKFFALAFFVAAASAKDIRFNVLAPPTELEYGFCDGSPTPLTFDVMSVAPFPILVSNGASITLEVQITLNEEVAVEPRWTSTLSWRASSPSRSPASTLRASTSDHATTMETSSCQLHLTSSAPPTCQRARLAPSPLDPESTEAETPSCLDPSSPSRTSSCPSSREPSGPRPPSPTPPGLLLPACLSGPPSTTNLLTLSDNKFSTPHSK